MNDRSSYRKTFSVSDAVAIIVGIVIGAGIFKTPSLVAGFSGNETVTLLAWLAGGVISFVGALCYAELASTYPHVGGDYHYLYRAFGKTPAFLFAWSRMTVIQSGSIAMLAFLIGDYASEVLELGAYSSSLYAGLTIVIITGLNIAGIRQGVAIQKVLVTGIVMGLLLIAAVGFALVSPVVSYESVSRPSFTGFGGAMVFVLLTYGGWNEAAYLSAEVRNGGRNMVRVLLYSIGIITLVYLIVNFVFIKCLGLQALTESEVVAADLMRRAFGESGAIIISVLIVIVALSTLNGVIITGARTNYALGRDFTLFSFLDNWHERGSTPVNALLLQGGISLVLILLGAGTRSGFVTMVEYTAPVFWFFFLMAGISLFVLRRKDAGIVRPFHVPLYPVTPILFCVFCLFMLQSSIAYTGKGSLFGVCVLLAGVPLVFLKGSRSRKKLT